MKSNLTAKQEKFLDTYFELLPQDMTANQRLRAAADAAGYSPNSNMEAILRGVAQELVERTYEYTALHLPHALQRVIELLDNPTKLGATNVLAAATTILDRGGLSKVEKLNIKSDAPNAILVLPAKTTIKEKTEE